MFTRGWKAKHLEDCGSALDLIRQRADRVTIGSNLIDYSFIQFFSSEYRAAHNHAVEGLTAIVQESENNPYLNDAFLHQIILPWSLLFLGEWGEALNEIDSADVMMGRNADYPQARANQIYRAFVRSYALDFAGVVEICDPLLPSLNYPPHARFCSILMASAELNRGNYASANTLLSAVQEDMQLRPASLDWYRSIMIESALTELWLAQGDLKQARSRAARFLDASLATAERTLQALAWEANARVAIAETDLGSARESIANALSTMEGFEVPLAVWRVHATAAELSRAGNKSLSADYHRELSRATILKLADSLATEETLRKTFLSAPFVRKVLGNVEIT